MEVFDSDPDPVNFWIKKIYDCDLQSLQPNRDVTENASQKVLKDQFSIGGCQSTALAHSLKFSRAPTDKLSVQVLHTGTVLGGVNVFGFDNNYIIVLQCLSPTQHVSQ